MLNFTFSMPTKVIFGRDTELAAAQEIKERGYQRVLVHYGGSSAKKSGLLDRVLNSLKEADIPYVTLGGVVPNPRLGLIREGIALCKKEKIDFILAIGGGSVIDSSKAIAYGIANECDVWEIYEKNYVPTACAPVGAILTIAAAGSETSNSSVVTNEDGWMKKGYGSELCRPKFAIMNPELTCSLPPYQTASGGVDIMMHVLERYFTPTDHVELTDRLCEAVLKTVIHNIPFALKDANDYDARAEIMWSGSIAHNSLLNTGRQDDWASHQLEHELGGMFDVAHGAGLAAVWGSWARYVLKSDVNRFAMLAVNVMGCQMNESDPESTAIAGIEAMEAFFRSIGMPTSISDLGIQLTDEQIKELAYKCTYKGRRTIGAFQVLKKPDMIEIYKMAR